MVVAGAIDDLVTLASADEAAKPMEANDNVSASSFFIFLFPSQKK